MSLYLAIFIALCIATIIEYYKKCTPKSLYNIIYIILLVMLCFRYGQGTDYFGYYDNFLLTPAFESFSTIPEIINSGVHGEPGWLFINSIFKRFEIPFEVLVFLVAIVDMILFNRFVQRHCTRKIFALFISYPTLYLTYFFSGLRQGIVIAFFLGVLLDWYLERNYIKYCIGTVLCMCIHSMAVILIIIPVLDLIRITLVKYSTVIFFSFCIGMAISFTPIMYLTSYGGDTPSVIAILERIISYIVIVYSGHVYYKDKHICETKGFSDMFRIYIYGLILYGLLWSSALVSSRMCIPFKCMEIALFSELSSQRHKTRKVVFLFCVMMTSVMFFKNIQAYILQGGYYDFVNVLNYPYISVFDSSDILNYKEIIYDRILKILT